MQRWKAVTKQEILLKTISSYSFAIYELKLFLDTHPADAKTIERIREFEEKLAPLREEYISKYGPLTTDENKKDYWTWVNSPWPWEGV